MEQPKIQFIKRNNSDKREKKIIHPFDGRGMPLDHRLLEDGSRILSEKFKGIEFDYIVGFAEGGLILFTY